MKTAEPHRPSGTFYCSYHLTLVTMAVLRKTAAAAGNLQKSELSHIMFMETWVTEVRGNLVCPSSHITCTHIYVYVHEYTYICCVHYVTRGNYIRIVGRPLYPHVFFFVVLLTVDKEWKERQCPSHTE